MSERWSITDTLAGPVVHCNYDCDYDEADGALLVQCPVCKKVQDQLDKPFLIPSKSSSAGAGDDG